MKLPDPLASPKRGRPQLPKAEVRSERIVTLLTPSQRHRLTRLAESTGQTLSSVAHDLIAQGLEREENPRKRDI